MEPATALTQFFEAWAEEDESTRRTVVAEVCLEDAVYIDPMVEGPLTDTASISSYISNFAKMAPGGRAEVVEPVDLRHGYARCTVRFVMGDKTQLGQYFAEVAANGRLARIVGFPGKGPE